MDGVLTSAGKITTLAVIQTMNLAIKMPAITQRNCRNLPIRFPNKGLEALYKFPCNLEFHIKILYPSIISYRLCDICNRFKIFKASMAIL